MRPMRGPRQEVAKSPPSSMVLLFYLQREGRTAIPPPARRSEATVHERAMAALAGRTAERAKHE